MRQSTRGLLVNQYNVIEMMITQKGKYILSTIELRVKLAADFVSLRLCLLEGAIFMFS